MNAFAAQKENVIQWKQLWSLAALYGSVVIGWIAYQNYQPRLLDQFHFNQFALLLTVAQAIILVVTPPVAGLLGDRYRATKGHRIPIIMGGMSFAAMIFMAVAFTLFSNPGEVFKWVLPVLIVLWLLAMSIFTSPALSTLELFTPVEELPMAMAVLTIVANLLYSLEPVIVDIIDFLGAPLTFIAGGVIVFISGYALKRHSLVLFQRTDGHEAGIHATPDATRSPYGVILLLGVALGIATTVLFNLFPETLEHKLPGHFSGKVLIVGVLVVSAFSSFFMTMLINLYGLVRVMLVSLVVVGISMAVIFISTAVPLVMFMVAVFALAFASLSVSSLPLAMAKSNQTEKVFCVGIFFSGVALPEGLVDILQALPSHL